MSKLNRIGNKLGLASALGILLSVGMVLNQNSTQSSVSEVASAPIDSSRYRRLL
jgi:hypothetical protein